MEDLELTILGSSSALPISNRHPTSQFLTISNRHFLIDCGEGTQIRLRENGIGFSRINHILISHMHGDHVYGLVPLLTSLHLLDRQKEMHIYGPPNLKETVENLLKNTGAYLKFPLVFHAFESGKKALLFEDNALEIYTFPLKHSLPCWGFLFKEKARAKNIKGELIEKLGIPYGEINDIKQGADFEDSKGTIHKNETLTTPALPALSYAFCTDTAPLQKLSTFISEPDILYHEATFTEEHAARAKKTKHSTAKQAAEIAKLVQAKNLLLGHFSVRYNDFAELLSEAKPIFEATQLALQGTTFLIKRKEGKLLVKE